MNGPSAQWLSAVSGGASHPLRTFQTDEEVSNGCNPVARRVQQHQGTKRKRNGWQKKSAKQAEAIQRRRTGSGLILAEAPFPGDEGWAGGRA